MKLLFIILILDTVQRGFAAVTCEPGFSMPTTNSSCHPCEPGYHADNYNQTLCTGCLMGTYQDEVESQDCKVCLIGTYQDEIGSDGCKSCTPGYYGVPVFFPNNAIELSAAITECLAEGIGDGSCPTLAGTHGVIGDWDVSKVTSMTMMFFEKQGFNADISQWDISQVTTTFGMFMGASNFNQDLSTWDTSKVTEMTQMFAYASAFNGNISTWDTSKVTTTNKMFSGASAFNGDLSKWDTSRLTLEGLSLMFLNSGFEQYLCGGIWTSEPAHEQANGPYSSFGDDIGKAKFGCCPVGFYYNPQDTACVACPTGKIAPLPNLYPSCTTVFTPNNRAELKDAVDACLANAASGSCSQATYGVIGDWDVSKVTDMHALFQPDAYNGYPQFNQDLSKWETSQVTNMNNMFYGAAAFNKDLSTWDTGAVQDMNMMFYGAAAFNGDVSTWDTSQVINMYGMFLSASAFNGDVSTWDTSQVTNMNAMFMSAQQFDQQLCWDSSQVTDMGNMFFNAHANAKLLSEGEENCTYPERSTVAYGNVSGGLSLITGCRPCEPGYYTDHSNQTLCKVCLVGTYQDEIGSDGCKSCTRGYYGNVSGGVSLTTSCEACAIGKYQNEEGKEDCKKCVAGFFQKTDTAWECESCPAGQYENETGQSKCKDCPIGYRSEDGNAQCVQCGHGQYTVAKGQASCTRCPWRGECQHLQVLHPKTSLGVVGRWYDRKAFVGTRLTLQNVIENGKNAVQTTEKLYDNFNAIGSVSSCVGAATNKISEPECRDIHWSSGLDVETNRRQVSSRNIFFEASECPLDTKIYDEETCRLGGGTAGYPIANINVFNPYNRILYNCEQFADDQITEPGPYKKDPRGPQFAQELVDECNIGRTDPTKNCRGVSVVNWACEMGQKLGKNISYYISETPCPNPIDDPFQCLAAFNAIGQNTFDLSGQQYDYFPMNPNSSSEGPACHRSSGIVWDNVEYNTPVWVHNSDKTSTDCKNGCVCVTNPVMYKCYNGQKEVCRKKQFYKSANYYRSENICQSKVNSLDDCKEAATELGLVFDEAATVPNGCVMHTDGRVTYNVSTSESQDFCTYGTGKECICKSDGQDREKCSNATGLPLANLTDVEDYGTYYRSTTTCSLSDSFDNAQECKVAAEWLKNNRPTFQGLTDPQQMNTDTISNFSETMSKCFLEGSNFYWNNNTCGDGGCVCKRNELPKGCSSYNGKAYWSDNSNENNNNQYTKVDIVPDTNFIKTSNGSYCFDGGFGTPPDGKEKLCLFN